MNNKVAILMLLIIALITIGSGNNGEKIGNPHIDDDINVSVECICYKAPNCSNITPLIIEGDTIITKDLIEGFLCENGFVLFSERTYPGELAQTWMTPGGEFIRVGLYEDLNGFPRLRIYDQTQYELKTNEIMLS